VKVNKGQQNILIEDTLWNGKLWRTSDKHVYKSYMYMYLSESFIVQKSFMTVLVI